MATEKMATENPGRMTPDEAEAVVRLWSQREWERRHWPTVSDVAEGLDIPVAEAEALLREVREGRTHLPHFVGTPPETGGERGKDHCSFPSRCTRCRGSVSRGGRGGELVSRGGFLWRFAAGVAGLTTIFSLFLNRFLA